MSWWRKVWPWSNRELSAASRATQADIMPQDRAFGVGADWAPTEYADYYARSPVVYAAIRTRADAISRVPWVVSRTAADGSRTAVGPLHPAQRLLDTPNGWLSGSELRKATEIHLCLWGRAFWAIEPAESGLGLELWPLRPDRMTVIPGDGPTGPYIKGFLYRGLTADHAYLPEEIAWFRLWNPLQDRTGLSPMAPMRLSADMAYAALSYNRNTLRKGAIPDYILLADEELTDAAVEDFYRRWEARFSGPNQANRPGIASFIRDVKPLAFSNRDMEFLESLRWTVKDASRVFGVPETMLAELEFATLANVDNMERSFWHTTVVPQLTMMSERITSSVLGNLGYQNLIVAFDYTGIAPLNESGAARVARQTEFLDRGVVTINEVRRSYDQPPVSWGDEPHFRHDSQAPPSPVRRND